MIGSIIFRGLALILWLLLGITNLHCYRISKGDYALCWAVLMMYMACHFVTILLEALNG